MLPDKNLHRIEFQKILTSQEFLRGALFTMTTVARRARLRNHFLVMLFGPLLSVYGSCHLQLRFELSFIVQQTQVIFVDHVDMTEELERCCVSVEAGTRTYAKSRVLWLAQAII